MTRPPCKDCPDRRIEPNCHDDCTKYIEWRDGIREAKRKAQEDKEERREIEFKIAQTMRRPKRRHE